MSKAVETLVSFTKTFNICDYKGSIKKKKRKKRERISPQQSLPTNANRSTFHIYLNALEWFVLTL